MQSRAYVVEDDAEEQKALDMLIKKFKQYASMPLEKYDFRLARLIMDKLPYSQLSQITDLSRRLMSDCKFRTDLSPKGVGEIISSVPDSA
jgi:hypothetical protein